MRTINNILLTLTSVLTLSALSSAVSAACSADLRGTWSFYGQGSTIQYSNCNFSMDRDGNLEPGSGCTVKSWTGSLEPDAVSGLNTPVFNTIYDNFPASGQYVVQDDCSVVGNISVGVVGIQVVDAKINNSRDVVRGIQYDNYGGTMSMFTMFRVD